MRLKSLLAGAALAAVAAGSATAGPFDMLRERFARPDFPTPPADSYARVAAIDDSEIGRFVEPTNYQPLAAPGGALGNETLRPVPEPYLGSPSLGPPSSTPNGPITNYGPPTEPYPAYPGAGGGFPIDAYPAGPQTPFGSDFAGMPLFPNVKIEDPDHIAPCAVTKVIQVPDPCAPPCGRCGPPPCVFIAICVPPNQCPQVKVVHGGRKIKYIYGGRQVEVSIKKGYIEVDYDD